MRSLSLYHSVYGTGGVISSELGVCDVILPFGGGTAEDIYSRYPGLEADRWFAGPAAAELTAYFSGSLKQFVVPLDLRHLTAFALKVCRFVAAIPYGEVRRYGEVAEAVGLPRAARAVGAVMAANRLPLLVPCHRVVARDGAMCGYSAAGGVAAKLQLLKLEGVSLTSFGRVEL